MARNYYEMEDCDKAIFYYKKVIAKEPDHIEAKLFLNLQRQ